jgi:hypothetical protein
MERVLAFTAAEIAPDSGPLLAREAHGRPIPARLRAVFDGAMTIFDRLAAPSAVVADVSVTTFAEIYSGENLNAPATPLHEIFPRATRLALFAATLGDPVSQEIGNLFKRDEPAMGYALDVIASEATNILADRLASRYEDSLHAGRAATGTIRVLPYSPGYCGWHISGQRRLFAHLQPHAIGMQLAPSFLMRPLKSVSGVLVAGPPSAHRFRPTYPFCEDCTTHECRRRMASVLRKSS